MDIGTDLVGNGHNLINSGSSLIADTSAGFTANRIIDHLLIERGNAEKLLFFIVCRPCTLACGTKLTHQTLCDDTNHRVTDQVRLHAHINQTGDGCRRGIGMQGGNNQVTGYGCLYRNTCRLTVTDFSDHNDIRVLTQNRTECTGESKIRLHINLHLVNTVHICFHRIFYCDNIYFFSVQLTQHGITGSGLTTSGRSCYQNNSVRIL